MNKTTTIIIFLLFNLSLFATAAGSGSAEIVQKEARMAVYFSPGGGATEALVKEISKGKKEILVQAYTLTYLPIFQALLDAHQRGLAVRIIIDKSERGEGLTPAVMLANKGVPVFWDGRHALAHSNCLVIDRQTVITGSFNFTKVSEDSNAEDLLIIQSPQLAQQYRAYWETHKAHSEPY